AFCTVPDSCSAIAYPSIGLRFVSGADGIPARSGDFMVCAGGPGRAGTVNGRTRPPSVLRCSVSLIVCSSARATLA
ncbi:MAG: hypothetical protein KA200_02465, partial [Burkholderiales bacterium]|nr:hypothetical protein [Burkholderiales bacterium]